MTSVVAAQPSDEGCQYPNFRRKFFGSSSWNQASPHCHSAHSIGEDTKKYEVSGNAALSCDTSSPNHIQRPTMLRTLDLKSLPAHDSLSNNSPSETQKRRSKYQFYEKQCSKIAEGLYLSGDTVAKNWETLQECGITHVINCVGFICQEYFKDRGVQYRTYFLQDTPAEDILCILYDAFEFIDTATSKGGRVLVHCSQGVSRSATIVIAYLMWKTGATYDDAFASVKGSRGVANPNIGFCCQLLQWQKRRQPRAAMRTRLYRIGPHSLHAPTQLVPKVVIPPKQYSNNTYRDLDPRGAFIIQSPDSMYVWIGESCPPQIAASAEYHARLYPKYESNNVPGQPQSKPVIVVKQDAETPEFVALMDPPLLNADQQRVNARRNSITGDLLQGTSGLTGFSSLGLALGSASPAISSTPRSGSPAPDTSSRCASGTPGGPEPMDVSDSRGSGTNSINNSNCNNGGHSERGRRHRPVLSHASSAAPGSPRAAGSTSHAHSERSSRLQVSTTARASEGASGPLDLPAGPELSGLSQESCRGFVVVGDQNGVTGWWIDEVDEYSQDYNLYADASARKHHGLGMPSQGGSLGGRDLSASETAACAVAHQDNMLARGMVVGEAQSDGQLKKYRRSDCGLQSEAFQRMGGTERMKA